MRAIDLLLSFDHELSLGAARDYEENVFRSTRRLLDVADEAGVKVTLFTDVHAAMRFEEWDREGYFEPYCEQIRDAISRGHDAQLHIHPHWADSHHDGTTFQPSRSFALSDFADRPADDPLSIEGIVDRGATFLTDLCRSEDPDYRCVAYRAGGFNLAPETARILNALWDSGIRVDSSIPKGFTFESELSSVDHTQVPDDANWRIAPDGPLDRPAAEGLYEVPVGTRPRTPLNNLPFLIKRVLLRGRAHASGGYPIHLPNTPLTEKLKRMFPRSAWQLGFDVFTDSVDDQMRILHHHLRAHPGTDRIAIGTLSHPKNMGDYSMELMRGFIERTRQQYGDAVSFPTFRELHDRLVGEGQAQPAPEAVVCPVP